MKMQILYFTILICSIQILQSQSINQPGMSTKVNILTQPNAVCQSGYFFNSQICLPCKQIIGGYCLCSSYNQCDTLICNDGMIEYQNLCIKHPDSNCLSGGVAADGSSIVCYQCKSSLFIIGGICLQANQCATMNTLNGACMACLPGYFLNESMLQSPIDDTQYYLSIKSCEACNERCLYCTTKNVCQSCKKGYYLDTTFQFCEDCSQAIAYCSDCVSKIKCAACIDPYYVTFKFTCESCQTTTPNCLHCDLYVHNQIVCSLCEDGYFLDSNSKCISCQINVSNCQICSNDSICDKCLNGYYLNNNTCRMCTINLEGCLECLDNQQCTKCSIGYYLNQNVCIQCSISISNCSKCENNQICNECIIGYYLDNNNNCKKCSDTINNCSECENNQKCNKCLIGYYFKNYQCSPCIDDQCQDCQNDSTCVTCNLSYQWNGTKCETCITQSNDQSNCSNTSYYSSLGCQECSIYMENCSTCSFSGNNLKCQTCTDSSITSTNSEPCSVSKGITCPNGSFVNGTNCIFCDKAIPKCICCQFNNQNELECTQCNDGYSLGGQNEPCIQNTQNQGSNQCNNCPSSKYYNNNEKSCDSCSNIQNCQTCSDQSTCINCIDSYFYINNICTQCSTIILNCVTCDNNQTCKECVTGYYLDQNTCNVCSNTLKNCISCIDNQTCKICDTGYYLKNNNCLPCSDENCINCQQNPLICTNCASGFYLEDEICKSCSIIDGCISCKNNIQCTACQSGLYLNQNTKQCSKCSDQFCINCNGDTNICQICQAGYYLNSNNECQQCSIGCTSCTNSQQCQSCQAGYHLDGNQCLKCSINLNQCTTCISNSICTSCIQGYFLSNNKCQQCPSSLKYCINCLNDQICSVCQNGYYLDGITCKICTNKNCLSCINTNICTQCQNDYILNSGACQSCKGYSQYCTACQKSACSKCINGYVLLSVGTCSKCPQYCYAKCSENPIQNTQYQTICYQCYDGYYFNQDRQCQNCQQNDNNALRCSYNFNTKQLMIIQCQDGYFLVNNLCIKAQNVNTCAQVVSTQDGSLPDSNNCLECWPNYFQNGQKCFICNNCQKDQCIQDENGNFICKQCSSQYYADDSGICQSCAQNCLNCTSSNIVDCSECLEGYFNNMYMCKACTIDQQGQTTCLICSDSDNCQTCKDGFFYFNGKCYSCQVGCRQCNYPGNTCLSCQNGYYFQNGGCVLFQANCLTFTNGSQIIKAQNQDTGCEACNYGFYKVQGWLTQSSFLQVKINICLQCINAESSFVCRPNPKSNQIRTIITQNTITNRQYFIAATPVQVGMERKSYPSCQIGYFWNSQSCMPCMGVTNGICACKNFDSCDQIICSDTFYLVSLNSQQYCLPIPQGCSKIIAFSINQIACTECNSGYLLVGTICILSKGCKIMNQNSGVCMICQDGYYFNNNFLTSLQQTTIPDNDLDYYNYFNSFCSPCQIKQCDICQSEFTCLTCKNGYFWMQSTINQTYPNPQSQNNFIPYQSNQNNQASGQCVACLKYCAKCTDQNSCHACFINFQLKIDSNNVYSCYCPDDYVLNADSTCTAQQTPTVTCNLIGCAQCNSDGTQCLACQTNSNYALTGTTCTQCPQNCNSCTAMNGQQNSTTTCSECQDGYFKVQSSTDQPVMCQSCSSQAQGALRCQGQLENQSSFTIIQCQDGYYLYNNTTCVKTLTTPTCYLISSQSNLTCQSCLPGYTLYGSTCANCSDAIKNCSACQVSANLNGLNCLLCSDGYILNPNLQVCDQCPTGCQICFASINNGQLVYQCQTCLEGNFLNAQGQCQGCPYYCKQCTSAYYCNICQDGYYLAPETKFQNNKKQEFRACHPCQDNCQTCIEPGNICLTCPSQYIQYNGGCISNQNIQQVTQIQYTLPCLLLNSQSTGCEYCLCGFFMDKYGICRECVSPYSNFACIVQPIPNQPSPPNNQYSDPPQKIRVGENPQQPNTFTVILMFYILNLII